MGRGATKAAGNVYYEARIEAAKWDEKLASRAGAADALHVSEDVIIHTENNLYKHLPVETAVLMADRYNAPQLLNHYCTHECPIGCRHSIATEVVDLDRVTVKYVRAMQLEKLSELQRKLLDIAADGKITEEERPEMRELVKYLDGVAKIISEVKLLAEMALGRE